MILAVLLAALPSDGLEPSTAVLNFPPQLGVLIDEQGPAFAVAFQWAGELRTTTRPWLRPTHLALDAGALIGRQTRFTTHGGLRWLHALTPWALLGPGFGRGVDVGRDARPVTQLEWLGVGSLGFALSSARSCASTERQAGASRSAERPAEPNRSSARAASATERKQARAHQRLDQPPGHHR